MPPGIGKQLRTTISGLSSPLMTPFRPRKPSRTQLVGFALFAVVLTAALLLLDANQAVRALVRSVDLLGWKAGPLFVVVHAAMVVLLLPGAIFPLMAGFLFGPVEGAIYSTLGKTLGGSVAFCIARYLIGGHRRARWMKRLRSRYPRLSLLESELADGGWKSMAMIRLIPVIPFKISSYAFGWSRFRMKDFIVGTFLGTLPYSLTNAYLGSLAGNLGSLGTTPLPQSPLGWALYSCAGLLALSAAIVATVRVRRILARSVSRTIDD